MRYELTDYEWTAIKPMLPNRQRGVPRVNDRRVLNGIFWVLRSGAPWRDLPNAFGPYTTCYNRFVRWRRRFFLRSIFACLDGESMPVKAVSMPLENEANLLKNKKLSALVRGRSSVQSTPAAPPARS